MPTELSLSFDSCLCLNDAWSLHTFSSVTYALSTCVQEPTSGWLFHILEHFASYIWYHTSTVLGQQEFQAHMYFFFFSHGYWTAFCAPNFPYWYDRTTHTFKPFVTTELVTLPHSAHVGHTNSVAVPDFVTTGDTGIPVVGPSNTLNITWPAWRNWKQLILLILFSPESWN